MIVVTFVAGVVDLYILVSTRAGVSEDSAVHGNMTVGATLAPGSDHPQSPGRHAVDGPVGVAVVVADRDGKSSIVCSDDVEVETRTTGDVESAVLTGVVRLVLVTSQRLWNRQIFSPGCCRNHGGGGRGGAN